MSSGDTGLDHVPPDGRPKRGASLTELELAFAQDPQSSAYIPLCEAYLEQGRFMEAMVVCKKGLKVHPGSVEAKVLLANVYARQQKFSRALQEMDEVINAHAQSGLAYLGRGKIRLESGDDKGAVADLKKALDLDKTLEEATELLKKRGIVYPEPVAAPPPPPPPPPPQAMAPPQPRMPSYAMPQPNMQQPPPRAASALGAQMVPPPVLAHQMPMPQTDAQAWTNDANQAAVTQAPMRGPSGQWAPPMSRGASGVLPRPRLEGEEELEAMAQKVADEKPDRGGNAKASLFLLVAGFFALVIGGGVMFHNKRVTEGIADLTKSARFNFAADTYASYKKAAAEYEKILEDYDSDHPQTVAALAHTYAILWGEHGEADSQKSLERVLPMALKKAPDSSHAAAANGLSVLYTSDDRHKAAQAAYDAVWPFVQKHRGQALGAEGEGETLGTYADMTLGIIDLELGNYQSAQDTLQKVTHAMPGSVRAKVWYGRAAHRSGDLGKAEVAYSNALQASKDHPGARAGRALVRVQRGRLQDAASDLVLFHQFAEKFPKEVSRKDMALAQYAQSEVWRAAGEEASAQGAYDMAIRLDKQNADFPYGLGRVLLSQKRPKEALTPLKQAVQMEPNRRAFLIALAEAETEVGEYASAEKHISDALKQNPQDLDAAMAKAALLRAQKKPETESYLKEVLKWSNNAPPAKLELGRYYRAVGRTAEARKELEVAVNGMDNLPQTTKAEMVLELGKVSLETNEDELALGSFKQAGEWGVMEGWYRAIQLMVKNGRRDKPALKDACGRYLGAGSQPYTNEAKSLCAGMM
jgi:cellulose synthase operon protein C